ncbi:MAG: 50S ribosomal protein L24 [Microscillaceae bacterium]|nr:50S ribosomal protein L24 [Microscillaceae bacterium]MDW8461828.1 50S ribosomal protein L24 [Cytophagales bacterium]
MEKKSTKPTKLHVKKGDWVLVIAGDSKGKQGEILSVDTKKQRAIVAGLNIVKKHVKPSAKNPQGGIIEKEAPIHISNLMLIDKATGKAKRTGKQINSKTGKKERVFKPHALHGGRTV